MKKNWKDLEASSGPRPKPTFDADAIVTFLGAYVAAGDEADRRDETVKVPGFSSFRVCPTRQRREDLGA